MRISFDHQAFCLQKTGGISRYFCRLAQELADSQEVGIFAPLFRNKYLKDVAPRIVHGYSVKDYPPKTASIAVRVNGCLSNYLMKAWHPDVIHETYFSYQASGPLEFSSISKKKIPRIITVFDMISELDLNSSKSVATKLRESAKFAAVSRADHIICISEHTRQDLIRLFSIPENKTSVIHLGCDVAAPSLNSDLCIKNPHRPYLLYVGLRDGYKNFSNLLKAYAYSTEIKNNFDLIAFGGLEFSKDEEDLIKALSLNKSQIKHQIGDDDELNQLYVGARAFIYPSIYEGFGLPPLEAMAHNCPVVSSDRSSMPEVIGEAAEYFDPENIESMITAMENVLFSEQRSNELRQKGKERVKEFTWTQCAHKTLHIYEELT